MSGGRHSHSGKAQRSKKIPITVGIAVLVILYIAFSAVAWMRLDSNANKWALESRTTIDGVAQEIRQPQENVDLESARTTLTRISEDTSNICHPNILIRWQGTILDRDATQCETTASNVRTVVVSLDRIAQYLTDETNTAEILATMAQGESEVDEKKWESTKAGWQDVRAKIDALEVSTAFEPTKEELLTNLDAIDKAWAELISSNKEKNLAAFGDAKDALTKAHKGLTNVSSKSAKRLTELDEEFITAYETAFHIN